MREPYWFLRYFDAVARPDGTVEEVRCKANLGPSRGPERVDKRTAEREAEKILARVNGISKPPKKQHQAPEGDFIIFKRLVEMYREAKEENLAATTRRKNQSYFDLYLLPRFGEERLDAINHHAVQVWVNGLKTLAWASKNDVRNLLHGVFEYAAACDLYTARNPASKIDCGRKRLVYKKTIPNPDQVQRMFALLQPLYRLICSTALLNGMRISEVLGLQWKVIDMRTGLFDIAMRYSRGDMDVVKSDSSIRRGTLEGLLDEYRALYIKNGSPSRNAFVFDRMDGSGDPIPYETIRGALKVAAGKIGFDYLGFGLHALRRANITWRQSTGASSIEASKMAGHSDVQMTSKYTQIQDERLRETTQAVGKLFLVSKKKEGAA